MVLDCGEGNSLYTIIDHSILVIRVFIIFFVVVPVLVEVEFKAALVDGPGVVDVVPVEVFLADGVVLDRLLAWRALVHKKGRGTVSS